MASIENYTVKSVWSSHETDWLYLPADNTTGDFLICWRSELVECTNYIKDETSISCLFVNKKNKESLSLEFIAGVTYQTEKNYEMSCSNVNPDGG